MASGSYMWSPLPEEDAVELHDAVSGRAAMIRRPPADLSPMEDILRLEHLALRRREESSARTVTPELFGALDAGPLRVLTGMNWLIAFWAVLWDLRTSEPADDLVRGLDYTGPWRDTRTPERKHVWQTMTARIRTGVLAALTGDRDAHRDYTADVERLAPDIFLHMTLTIMDELGHNLARNGLDLRGMAATLAERTRPGEGGQAFGRPH